MQHLPSNQCTPELLKPIQRKLRLYSLSICGYPPVIHRFASEKSVAGCGTFRHSLLRGYANPYQPGRTATRTLHRGAGSDLPCHRSVAARRQCLGAGPARLATAVRSAGPAGTGTPHCRIAACAQRRSSRRLRVPPMSGTCHGWAGHLQGLRLQSSDPPAYRRNPSASSHAAACCFPAAWRAAARWLVSVQPKGDCSGGGFAAQCPA